MSFIAVSVHYFQVDKLELQSKFIACEHFPGSHTAERITEKLESIFDRFGILNKVWFITTDSASNYLASLKHHGDNYESVRLGFRWADENSDDETVIEQTDDDDDDAASSDSDEMDFVPVFDCDEDENVNHTLGKMNHIRCAAHKLNRLASVDALKAKEKCRTYANKYDRLMNKMTKLWKIRDSRQQSEFFKKTTGHSIIGPHRIRWLGTHDAVSKNSNYLKTFQHTSHVSLDN